MSRQVVSRENEDRVKTIVSNRWRKTVGTTVNDFPRWETIFQGGEPFGTVGNHLPGWDFLLA